MTKTHGIYLQQQPYKAYWQMRQNQRENIDRL